jgi:hypothetical protein
MEVDSPDAKLAKIVLLAGSPSNKAGQHEYFAGCALIADWLKQTPGTWPVLVADGWPQNEQVLNGFAFTGCDLHRNWIAESQRRLVTNGILWSAKVEVLKGGAPVSMQPSQLAANLDAKAPPATKN